MSQAATRQQITGGSIDGVLSIEPPVPVAGVVECSVPVEDLTVRVAVPDDAAAIARMRAAAVPYLVGTAAGMRSRLTDRETSGRWVALVDGEPAGFALSRQPHEGASLVTVLVEPGHVRRGVGSALLRVAEETVLADGGTRINAVADGPPGRDFAIANGYAVGREHRFSGADLAEAPEPPPVPLGVELRPLAAVDPRAIWLLQERVSPDDPSGLAISQPYETWYEEDWAFPDHAADLGVAALEGGEPTAFTHVFADRERGAIWSAMTGVLPAHRGRGLAHLVKAYALRAARDAGMTRAYTANDSANAPMLAVNDKLGYRPSGQAWTVHRTIDRAIDAPRSATLSPPRTG